MSGVPERGGFPVDRTAARILQAHRLKLADQGRSKGDAPSKDRATLDMSHHRYDG